MEPSKESAHIKQSVSCPVFPVCAGQPLRVSRAVGVQCRRVLLLETWAQRMTLALTACLSCRTLKAGIRQHHLHNPPTPWRVNTYKYSIGVNKGLMISKFLPEVQPQDNKRRTVVCHQSNPISSEGLPWNRTQSNPGKTANSRTQTPQEDWWEAETCLNHKTEQVIYRRYFELYAAKHLDSDFLAAPVGQQLNHFSTIKHPFHLCQQLKIFDLTI